MLELNIWYYSLRPKAEPRRRKGAQRHNPLYEDVLDAQGVPLPGKGIGAVRNRKVKEAVEDADLVESSAAADAAEETMLPSKLGKKLLKLVEEQQEV